MAAQRDTVVVVTNGNFFAARVLQGLLVAPPRNAEVQLVVSASVRRGGGGTPVVAAWQLVRRWGARYTAFKLLVNVVAPTMHALTRRATTVTRVCRRIGVPVHRASNLNSVEGVQLLRELSPDVLVSVSCPYLLSADVLAVPSIGSVNVHSSLLPAYAGVSTYVHVLANGERQTGVTVHEMVPSADAGRVLRQARLVIEPGVSAFTLFARQCDTASSLLLEAVEECLRERTVRGAEQDLSLRSYFRDPSKADIERLRANGHVLIHRREVLALLRGEAQ